jgi:hypothetical protein
MHRKLDILAAKGYVILRDWQGTPIDRAEWESPEYMDWASAQSTSLEHRHQHYLMLALQSARSTRTMCDLVSH